MAKFKTFHVEAIAEDGSIVRFTVIDGKTLPGNGHTAAVVLEAVKQLRPPLSKVAPVELRS